MKKHLLLFTLLTLLAFKQMVWGQASVTFDSSGTWICPAGVTSVSAECWGGGGPGGNGTGFRIFSGIGGGGAGGAYARSTISVTPGTSYTVTVGAQLASGSNGNPSWFGSASTVFAEGGAKGNSGTATIASNNFGTGGTGSKSSSIGTVTFQGGNGFSTNNAAQSAGGGGSAGNASNGNSATSKTGAAAVTGGGAGGNGASTANNGGTGGSAPGGGGGGAWSRSPSTQGGGLGAPGQVILTYCNPATAVSSTSTGSGSGTISWTAPASYDNTNNETIVFLKNGSAITVGSPSNNISTYTANTVFGSGTAYENDAGAYCIYKGDGTSVIVTGITNGATYYALVLNTNSINGSTVYSTGATTNGVLPVELTSFSASITGNSVSLKWNTATEVNNYGFNIERGVQNQELQKIAFIKGHGNSNSPKSYSFVDASAPVGNVIYTLVQIDYDGTSKIIGTTLVTVVAPTTYALKQNYPNPFNPATIINYELPKFSHVTLKVYNLLGQEVAALVNTTQNAGSYSVNFSTNRYGMSSGIYFYRLDTGNYSQMKKMVVVK